MIYFKILSLALILYISLRALSWVLNVLSGQRKMKNLFLRIYPLAEFILWSSFAFWTSDQLFSDKAFYPLLTGSMIILLVTIIGWYLLRDFVSGIILKADNLFEPGQRIKTHAVSGTIKKLGFRSIQIVTSEGESVKIPYTLLSNKNINKPSDNGKWVGQVLKLNVPSEYPTEIIQNKLQRRMLEIPWIVPGDNLKIQITKKEEGYYSVEINYQSISPEMVLKTEENLRNFVKEELSGK